MTETDLLRAIQLAATEHGARLFRNNLGSYQDTRTSRWVRYGVANPGGSDLIGWTPHRVTTADVGRLVAIFTAIEGKRHPRKATPEQVTFLRAVEAAGGLATVAYDVETVVRLLGD